MRRLLLATALLIVAPGCLLRPNQGEVLCGANQSVTFSGYSVQGGQTVYLQAAPARTGPFTTLTTAVTSATGYTYGGGTIYPFSKAVVITAWGSTDATLRTYVRAVIYPTGSFLSPTYLATFDVVPPVGSTATTCVTTRVNAGDTLTEAVSFCVR